MTTWSARGAVSGLLMAGEAPAPGENPGGEGLAGLVAAALDRLGWTIGLAVLGLLVTLAGAAWMWGPVSKATGRERRRTR
ncbi:hypothetical protein [Kitasatospora sp. CB02891]|uniref:hypothetical protein n=1 Tax=Kitasatospora sp. CB02891 TaxID=2020329 RepID=UPI000C276A55|nr:hypothetical protein [Kitasatospora sp. CB02891]PJN21378.1 hypothetical protein CG736_33970 [Kitasatospora sp. CB02891]